MSGSKSLQAPVFLLFLRETARGGGFPAGTFLKAEFPEVTKGFSRKQNFRKSKKCFPWALNNEILGKMGKFWFRFIRVRDCMMWSVGRIGSRKEGRQVWNEGWVPATAGGEEEK